LNEYNGDFAKASGSIMTNYFWDKGLLNDGVKYAKDNHIPLDTVYFGSDCWGATGRQTFGFAEKVDFDKGILENNNSSDSHWGKGYGGAATGLVVNVLANTDSRLGTAIFAQGWAYEHFSPGTLVDRFMWEGKPDLTTYLSTLLPDKTTRFDINCNCPGSLKNHLRTDFRDSPITKFAKRYAAGSYSFFHTDYADAYSYQGGSWQAHLGQQSILPTPGERTTPITISPPSNASGTILAQFDGDKCTIGAIIDDGSKFSNETTLKAELTLHTLNVDGKRNPDITITYQRLGEFPEVKIQLIALVGGTPKPLDLSGQVEERGSRTLEVRNTHDSIIALGISVQGPVNAIPDRFADLIDIFELTVKPSGVNYPTTAIESVALGRYDKGAIPHIRLAWSIPTTTPISEYLPYSSITQHVSHFVVRTEVEEWGRVYIKELGRAYALSFILDKDLYNGLKDKCKKEQKEANKFVIEGYAFDGSRICRFENDVKLIFD
jgi:hypothetical protein